MLFNSYQFIFLFLPITFMVYFYLNKKRLTKASIAWLAIASLFFYSWWNIIYLPLLLGSICFNFIISGFIVNTRKGLLKIKWFNPQKLLIIALIFNIGLLCYFKYMDFFIENFNFILHANIPLLHVILPLGISFFTITQIAYLVDCYEGLVEERNFLNYTLFVTFFPHLIAGPILHHKQMMPQFANIRNKARNYKNIALGLFIFSIGLFKKSFIADSFAKWANAGFEIVDSGSVLNIFESWVTILSYTFQLYFDFSGYSDMAIGLGLLFNIMLPINFNSPYKATSIIDFWKRWHISLTNFITTYIYTPIIRSFSKPTFNKMMFATFITFVIAGVWHGAGWNFFIFGVLHGSALVINHFWQKKVKFKMPKLIGWGLTFVFIVIAFTFFRAQTLDGALNLLKGMFGIEWVMLGEKWYRVRVMLENIHGTERTIAYIIVSFIIVLCCRNSIYFMKLYETYTYRLSIYACLLFACSFFASLFLHRQSLFLYFNF